MLINIIVFLVLMISKTLFFLFQWNTPMLSLLISKLSLPPMLSQLLYQPWSLITYMFLHADFWHILFNMLVLYWSGKLFTEYLGSQKLLATYIMGGLFGGLFYILAFNLFPAFQSSMAEARLLGASAGIIAILVATATLLPDYTVFLIIFGPVKLKYIAIFSILLYTISIPDGNAGGQIAHLGGALFGFVMIRQLRKGRDLTAWLNPILNWNKPRKTLMKVVKGKSETFKAANQESTNQETIDRILDKINQSGFDSLSRQEKEILYKASGKKS